MTYLWVALGAAVGAPLRYLTDGFVTARAGGRLPWGTFTVNVLGSLVLGLLTGAGLAGDAPWQLILGTGLCGALTTYSTFSWQTVQLSRQRDRLRAVGYGAGSVVVGLAAATVGYLVTDGLSR
jgi:CrcB protein